MLYLVLLDFFGTKFLIAPKYTASTSIYLTPQVSDSGSLDYNSQMANSKLVTNVVNLMTQNNVMSEVAKNVGMENAKVSKIVLKLRMNQIRKLSQLRLQLQILSYLRISQMEL